MKCDISLMSIEGGRPEAVECEIWTDLDGQSVRVDSSWLWRDLYEDRNSEANAPLEVYRAR